MNDNMSDFIKNFSQMMNNNNQSQNDSSNNSSNNSSDETTTNNIFENIDINTIMKMGTILNSMNNGQNDSRTNLLLSLKPYLKENKKNKVDRYIQLMKMGKAFEIMSTLNGDDKNAF